MIYNFSDGNIGLLNEREHGDSVAVVVEGETRTLLFGAVCGNNFHSRVEVQAATPELIKAVKATFEKLLSPRQGYWAFSGDDSSTITLKGITCCQSPGYGCAYTGICQATPPETVVLK